MASDVEFAELKQRLLKAGYQLARVNGSHHIFTKAGRPLVSIPVHRGKVKAFYARQVEKICAGD